MIKKYLTIIAFVFAANLYAQEKQEIIKDVERDTVSGRHFDQFLFPKVGTLFDLSENQEPIYFKKCQPLATKEQRNKCFSDKFYDVLRKNLKPRTKKYRGKEIKIVVQFTVSNTGILKDIRFTKSNDIDGEFEKEVIRVLKKMPEIVPAQKNGEFVEASYSFPINFQQQ